MFLDAGDVVPKFWTLASGLRALAAARPPLTGTGKERPCINEPALFWYTENPRPATEDSVIVLVIELGN
jgi:hypothetical protein